MDSPITLNGLAVWWSTVNEDPEQIKTDTDTINGSRQRARFPDKYAVKLTKAWMTTAEYQAIKAMVDSGNTIRYINTQSSVGVGGTLDFYGIPDLDIDDYKLGAVNMVPVSLTLRQP